MYCGNCGASASDGQPFCVRCGANLRPLPSTNNEPAAVQSGNGRYESRPPETEISVYASFWRRVAAWLLDQLVVLVVVIIVSILLTLLSANSLGKAVLLIPYLLVPWLYSALLESSSRQATFGKLALGIKVTDRNGHRLSFGRATGRYFAHILSGLTLCIGFAMAAFTERRQALHDMVAGTLVVEKSHPAQAIASALPAPTISFMGAIAVALFFMFLGPFGIGVLAAIAIPAYQEYAIRAQVSEGLTSAAPYKAAIARAMEHGDALSQIDAKRLNLGRADRPHFLDAVEVQGGVVVLRFGSSAHRAIAGSTLELAPGINEQRQLVWRCGYAPGSVGSRFPGGEPGQYTTIMPRYLPSTCRAPT